jgi:hypothetical protein
MAKNDHARLTDDQRLKILEGKAQTLEIWLKVAFAIAGLLGIGGAYFFNRAAVLEVQYDTLARKQALLLDQVTSLSDGLKTQVKGLLQAEAPLALKAEIANYVRYGDTVYIKSRKSQLLVGLDDGKGAINTGNGTRTKSADEGFFLDK